MGTHSADASPRRRDPGPSRHAEGLIAINIAAVIFGTAGLFGKIDVSPFWIVGLRAFFATIALVVFAVIRGQLRWPTIPKIVPLVISGAILALHWIAFFASVQSVGVAIATLTFATFPLFTVGIQAFTERVLPRRIEVLAGLIILIAVGLLVNVDISGARAVWGAIAGIVSAATFALFGSASKSLGQSLSPLLVSIYQNAVVAVLIAPTLMLSATRPAPSSLRQWVLLAVLGIVTTAIMHQLYFYALQRLSALTCSGFVALEPVYTILFASIFFNEPLTISVTISGAMILGASALLALRDRSPSGVVPT